MWKEIYICNFLLRSQLFFFQGVEGREQEEARGECLLDSEG